MSISDHIVIDETSDGLQAVEAGELEAQIGTTVVKHCEGFAQ